MVNFTPIIDEDDIDFDEDGDWTHPWMEPIIPKVYSLIPRIRINDSEFYRAQFRAIFNSMHPGITLDLVVSDTSAVDLNSVNRAYLGVSEVKLASNQHIVQVSVYYHNTYIWFVTISKTKPTLRSFTLHDCLS